MVVSRNTIRINKAFQPLYTSDKRYFLVTGSRGSLKSSSLHDFITKLTYQKKEGILFTRWTMVSAQTSIIPEFKETLARLKCEKDFHITNRKIINKKSGSFILFQGLKTASLHSRGDKKSMAGITCWVVEEAEDFQDEAQFDVIDDSIRANWTHNRVILVMNPTTKRHWVYQRFFKDYPATKKFHGFDVPMSAHPQVEHIHTTYHIAEALGYLNKDWLFKAKESLRKAISHARTLPKVERYAYLHSCHYYNNYIGGWLVRAKGAIITNWKYGDFDTSLPTCYGIDYGYTDPTACTKVAIDWKANKIYVKSLVYAPGIDDMPQALHAVDMPMKAFIVADTNEPRTTQLIYLAGWRNIVPAKKWQNSVIDGIRLMKQFQFIVDTDSPEIGNSFNEYKWVDDKENIPDHKFSHIPDSIRYPFVYQALLNGLLNSG